MFPLENNLKINIYIVIYDKHYNAVIMDTKSFM